MPFWSTGHKVDNRFLIFFELARFVLFRLPVVMSYLYAIYAFFRLT
jgi:hypothetical protein